MELNILKERDTPLLSRKRVTLEVTFKGPTPKRDELRAAIATKLKADKGLTIIKHIYTRYGVEKAKVIAHIYSKKEDMVRYEEKGVLKKHERKEEKKEEAKEEKPEAKKEEAPAPAEEKAGEENKEEPKE